MVAVTEGQQSRSGIPNWFINMLVITICIYIPMNVHSQLSYRLNTTTIIAITTIYIIYNKLSFISTIRILMFFFFLKHDTTRMIVIGPDMPKHRQKLGPSVRGTTIKQGCATVSIVVATFCGVKAKQQNDILRYDISRYFALLDSVILIFVIDLWPIWPRVHAENREVQLGYGSVLRSPDALMASKEYSSEMESTGGQQNIWNVSRESAR